MRADSVRRVLVFVFYGCVFALFGVAALDYVGFVYHQREGTAYGYVTVRQFIESPLKGSREEYDYVGMMDKSCARAVLPHQHTPPCWWLRRHKDYWTRP